MGPNINPSKNNKLSNLLSFSVKALETEEAQAEPGIAPSDVMSDKEALELLRSYYAIPENQRRRLFDLARVLSDVS